jgi:hypothetical protein
MAITVRSLSILVVLAGFIAGAFAVDGGDVSQLFSSGTYACCKNNGWEFMIARSYCSYGGVDGNGRTNVENARAGGLQYTDVYHFPCYGRVSASQQVQDDYNNVKGSGFGMMWFDIETNPSPGCGWSGDKAANCQFMGDLISAGSSLGIHMGIYSSEYMWGSIMGDCTVGADHGIALWYAHYDNSRSFSDFSGFGGWSKPAIKQYWDSVGFCGIGADANWYP